VKPRYRTSASCGGSVYLQAIIWLPRRHGQAELTWRPLPPNLTSSIKPEVHNVAQRHQRKTEPRPQGICIENFVRIGSAVPEICSRIDRQTHRQTGWSQYSQGVYSSWKSWKYWNLLDLVPLKILEISWNLIDPPGKFLWQGDVISYSRVNRITVISGVSDPAR